MTAKRIAVVGAGLGGLSAAARLAAAGHDVELFEQQATPGGKAGSELYGGYRFDTGPSLVTMPFVFDELFESAGKRREEYIPFTPLGEICRYFYPDGTRLSSFADRSRFAAEIEAKTADRGDSLHRFLDRSALIHRITAELFLEKSLHEVSTYRSAKTLSSILQSGRIGAFTTMDRMVRSYFRDERMIQFFDRYATYNGSNPYRTPGTLAIIPHVEYDLGAVAADEGIYSIPAGIARLAREQGVRFHYGVPVDRILVDSSRRVTGIEAANARLSFDAVVSNVDVVASYERLLGDPDAPLAKRYRRLEPSSSGLVFYFGMNESFPELGLHNIFFSGDYHAEFADIFERRQCPIDPTVYVNITSKTTPADAPAGGENWFVLANAPYDAGQSWAGEAERTRKVVLARLSSALGRDVERHISVESSMSPKEIAERTGSRFGSLYGISSNSRLAAFLRHPNRSPRHRGLYFCGGSVHPGGGMPLVVLSGKIASQLLQKDIERRII